MSELLATFSPSSTTSSQVKNTQLNNLIPCCDSCVLHFNYPHGIVTSFSTRVTQHLNEWHSSFGSVAITVLDSFFRTEKLNTAAQCQEFAMEMLSHKAFLYFRPRTVQDNGEVVTAVLWHLGC